MPLSPPVPTPDVQVNASENSVHGIFIGHNVTLGCLAMVDLAVDIDVTVSFTWKLETSVISATPRTMVSEKPQSAKNIYYSELQILEVDREFEGSYTCSFDVLPMDSEKPVLSSEASAELGLVVQG